MNINRFLLATLAGTITLFLSGIFIYQPFLPISGLPSLASDCLIIDDQPLWTTILTDLLFGGLITYIFVKWAGIKSLESGLQAGAGIGMVLGFAFAIIFYSALNIFNIEIYALGSLFFLIRFGIAGGAIGWILGRE